jgi:hypothetical protein
MAKLLSATEARDFVMLQHERTKAAYLYLARRLAVKIAHETGQVTINEVRKQLPPPDGMHPSVLGAVFRNKMFEHTGRYTTADHVASHARKVGIYKVKGK